jgi:hypothetical protein
MKVNELIDALVDELRACQKVPRNVYGSYQPDASFVGSLFRDIAGADATL